MRAVHLLPEDRARAPYTLQPASGFGQTNPPITDRSAVQSGNVSPRPVVTIGGVQAQVEFAGVFSPGLYQLSVVVPAFAPDGDNLVAVSYQGFSTQAGDVITVQH